MLLPYEQALTIRAEFPRIERELVEHEDLNQALVRLTSLSNLTVRVSFLGHICTVELAGMGMGKDWSIQAGWGLTPDHTVSLATCLSFLAERAKDPRRAVQTTQ